MAMASSVTVPYRTLKDLFNHSLQTPNTVKSKDPKQALYGRGYDKIWGGVVGAAPYLAATDGRTLFGVRCEGAEEGRYLAPDQSRGLPRGDVVQLYMRTPGEQEPRVLWATDVIGAFSFEGYVSIDIPHILLQTLAAGAKAGEAWFCLRVDGAEVTPAIAWMGHEFRPIFGERYRIPSSVTAAEAGVNGIGIWINADYIVKMTEWLQDHPLIRVQMRKSLDPVLFTPSRDPGESLLGSRFALVMPVRPPY